MTATITIVPTLKRPAAWPGVQTVHWDLDITATSSVVHIGQSQGTVSLLRRETVIHPQLGAVEAPLISGNNLRGRLRRIGAELLADAVGYTTLPAIAKGLDPDAPDDVDDPQAPLGIPRAAAAVLRSGGVLAKTSTTPLTGSRLATVRALIPQLGVFGGCAGGRTIQGAAAVGKALPHVREWEHLTGHPGPDSVTVTQLETFTHTNDSDTGWATTEQPHTTAGAPTPDRPMRWDIETYPAGTQFSSWASLHRATPLEVAFFVDVLSEWGHRGWIGGRHGSGHGNLTLQAQPTPAPVITLDWRNVLQTNRDAVLEAIHALT